jgi:hypothetical protein
LPLSLSRYRQVCISLSIGKCGQQNPAAAPMRKMEMLFSKQDNGGPPPRGLASCIPICRKRTWRLIAKMAGSGSVFLYSGVWTL